MPAFKESIKKFLKDGDAEFLDRDLKDPRQKIREAEDGRKRHNEKLKNALEIIQEADDRLSRTQEEDITHEVADINKCLEDYNDSPEQNEQLKVYYVYSNFEDVKNSYDAPELLKDYLGVNTIDDIFKMRDKNGNTIVHIAAKNGNVASLEWFKSKYPEKTEELLRNKNKDGKTPMDYNGGKQLVELEQYDKAVKSYEDAKEYKFGNTALLVELNDAFTEVLIDLPCGTIAQRQNILAVATKAREYNANGAIEAILKRPEISQNTVLATALKNLITEQRFDVAKRGSIDYKGINNSVSVHRAEEKWLDKMMGDVPLEYSEIDHNVHEKERKWIEEALDKVSDEPIMFTIDKRVKAFKKKALRQRKIFNVQLRDSAFRLEYIAKEEPETSDEKQDQKTRYNEEKAKYDNILKEYEVAKQNEFGLHEISGRQNDSLFDAFGSMSDVDELREAIIDKEYGRKIKELRLSKEKHKILSTRKEMVNSITNSAIQLSTIIKKESELNNNACKKAGVTSIQGLSEPDKSKLKQQRDSLIEKYNEKKTEYDIALQAYEEAKKDSFGFNESEHLEELDSVINRGYGQKLKDVFSKMVERVAMQQRVESETALRVNEESRAEDIKEGTTYLGQSRREEEHNIGIKDGEFVKGGVSFDTSSMISHNKDGFAAVVLNSDGEISLFKHHGMMKEASGEVFAHSSMNAQADVIFAGEIKVEEGKLMEITDHSGHYKPDLINNYLFLEHLKKGGIDISNAKIYSHEPLSLTSKEYTGSEGRYCTNVEEFYKTCTEDLALFRQLAVVFLQAKEDFKIEKMDEYFVEMQKIHEDDPHFHASLTSHKGMPRLIQAQLKEDIIKLHRESNGVDVLKKVHDSSVVDILSALDVEGWNKMVSDPVFREQKFNTRNIKAILEMKDISGNTIVHIAAKKGDIELLRLLSRYSDTKQITSDLLNEPNRAGKTPMDYKGGKALTTLVELKVVKSILESGGPSPTYDRLSPERVDKVMDVLAECKIVKGQNNKSGDTIEINGCKIAYAELKQQLYDVVDAAAKMDDPDRKKQISKFLDEFVKQSSDKVLKEKIQGLNADKHASLRNQ